MQAAGFRSSNSGIRARARGRQETVSCTGTGGPHVSTAESGSRPAPARDDASGRAV